MGDSMPLSTAMALSTHECHKGLQILLSGAGFINQIEQNNRANGMGGKCWLTAASDQTTKRLSIDSSNSCCGLHK